MSGRAKAMKARIRRIALTRQGLAGPSPFGHGIEGVARAIEQLGYVQLDTLSVVQRAHHHILWTRVPGYDDTILNRLVEERRIFEYWSHAASYLPLRDYRFCLPRMHDVRSGANRYFASADPKLMAAILDRIRIDGPALMRQFEDDGSSRSGSWAWGPVRRAFDRLFMQGDLTVVKRRNMEKLFDLTERWLPSTIDDRLPDDTEMAIHLIDRALAAHGAFRRDQLSYGRPGKAVVAALDAEIAERISDRRLIEIPCGDGPAYLVPPELWMKAIRREKDRVRILSPFDNSVIHRDRLSQLFGLEYRLECYVPKDKRRFGYFCLPLLYRESFAGLIDCKVDRAAARLMIVGLHPFAPWDRDMAFASALGEALAQFAAFNGCSEIAADAAVRGRHAALASLFEGPVPAQSGFGMA
jgi:uncharacterized protein YcaQ